VTVPVFDSDDLELPISVVAKCWVCNDSLILRALDDETLNEHLVDGFYRYSVEKKSHYCRSKGKMTLVHEVDLMDKDGVLMWRF